jgi:succinate-semialdehyde dehydrogenase/glutarate-semialdehyde dehydrogenase
MSIASINPATGVVLQTFDPISEDRIDQKLATAEETFRMYRKTPFSDRSKWMLNAVEILESEKEELGKLMTMEMGKPLKAAKEEAAKCAWACRFYAQNAQRFLSDEPVQTNASQSYVHYQPLGPILAVMPWNFPFWQVFRFAAPALMAGNVALLKHASNVPQCALSIEEIIRRSGFPQGAFQTLLIGSNQVKRVLEDLRIKAATLTGSEPAGGDVASIAGKNIKKTVLELGGSDPFIVMPTADLDEAVKTAVRARCINNGQSCIAAKRFIVHHKIADEFERRFVKRMEALKVGDPMDEETDVGPLATAQLLEQLDQQVEKTVSAGARVLTGGKKLDRLGNYYAPTVLTNIPKNSPAYLEEIFGPVALLFPIQNIDEAISLANDTTFGLGSAAWTNDEGEKRQFIDGIEAGAVFINGMVASDPRLPFGGVKHSGYGRELGAYGIREFVNIKTVWVK